MRTTLNHVVNRRFPPVLYACGYGSGVFKQATTAIAQGTMIDTILVVQSAHEWHAENRIRNPSDYAFLARNILSPTLIESIQRDIGGSMWFNTLIECETDRSDRMLMKYGVISVEDLIEDCTKWTKLYCAGRLQKPVLELDLAVTNQDYHPKIKHAIETNRINALRAALAMTKPGETNIPLQRLFEEIVGLSYGGDIRVGLAESPTKIQDIARGSFQELKDMYVTSFFTSQYYKDVDETSLRFSSKLSFPELVSTLPPPLNGVTNPAELRTELSAIIRKSSFGQTAKGVLTAGFSKSVRYGLTKVGKRFNW